MLLLPLLSLAVLKGGFDDMSVNAWGLTLGVAAFVTWARGFGRARQLPLVTLLYMALALVYLVSSVANGATLTTLAETGTVAACAAVSSLAGAQTKEGRGWTLGLLMWFGVVMAALGVLVIARIIQLPAGMGDGRLEFTFQYTNSMAAWFGVCVMLCLLGPSERARRFAALPIAAMLLTQSVGCLAVFLAVGVGAAVWMARSRRWGLLANALTQGALGILLFVVVYAGSTFLGVVALGVVICACCLLEWGWDQVVVKVQPRHMVLVLGAMVLVSFAVAITLRPTRVGTALASGLDRLYYIKDGLSLWLTSPLLGMGPNNWQYLFRYVQTGPYYTTFIHSYPIQVLVDAGVVGFGVAFSIGVVGVRALVRQARHCLPWSVAELCAAALLLLHALIDFDLQFGAIAFLLAFLITAPQVPQVPIRGWKAGVAVSLVCVPLCAAGLMCSMMSYRLQASNDLKTYEKTEQAFVTYPFCSYDVGAQSAYTEACLHSGEYERVVDAYARFTVPSDTSTLDAAQALVALGRADEAAVMLADRLDATPYDTFLAGQASKLVRAGDLSMSGGDRLQSAIKRTQRIAAESELAR